MNKKLIIGNVDLKVSEIIESKIPDDIEIVNVDDNEINVLVATCGGIIGKNLSKVAYELKPLNQNNKEGTNKSDRKRNRANRWR